MLFLRKSCQVQAAMGASDVLYLGKSFAVESVESTAAGRLRIYQSSSALAADRNRAPSVSPTAGKGLVLEASFDKAGSLRFTPLRVGGVLPGESCCWVWDSGPESLLTIRFLVLEH